MESETKLLDIYSKDLLLAVARKSLEAYVIHGEHYHPRVSEFPEVLQRAGNSFVTLTNNGKLRGCIGHTEAQYSLAEDVAQNAAAASRDLRFSPVTVEELSEIRLEVTVLADFKRLSFASYNELTSKLKPGEHGVMISSGAKRALLLPQVWHRIPDKNQFLLIIARKAKIPVSDLKHIPPVVEIYTFEAHHYAEVGYQEPTG